MSNGSMRSYGTVFIAVALALASVHCGQGGVERDTPEISQVQSGLEDVIVTDPTDPFAGLGRGRDLITEELRDFCIGAEKELLDYSKAYSRVYLDAAMTKDQIKTTMDYTASASAKLWKVDLASAEFQFNRQTEENDYSIVIMYGAEYALGGRTMDPMTRKMLVDPASTPNWFTRCGDHFLMQTDRGAQLWVSVRVEFDSAATKQKLIGKLGGKFGWGEVKTALDTNAEEFRSKALVHVEAFQKGGNVAALGQVLGATNAVECAVGDMTKCDSIVSTVTGYAGSADFRNGMYERPSDTKYYWNSWKTVLSTNVPPDRVVPLEIVEPRARIRQALLDQIKLWDRLRFVRAGVTNGQLATTNMFRASLPGLETAIARNLAALREAAIKCYDDVDDPANAAVLAACVQYADPAALASKGYDASIGMGHLEPTNGTVLGHVDGTVETNGATYLYGWACVKGSPSPIAVQAYTGTTLLGSAQADLASEPAVAQACNSNGMGYRFQAPLDGYIKTYGGKPLTVYGVSPWSDPKVMFGGSGTYTVPTAASRAVTGKWEFVAEDGHWYLAGFGCALTNPNPITVEMQITKASGVCSLERTVANLPSEPAVATSCQSGGAAYRYKFLIDRYVTEVPNASGIVYGFSPYGLSSVTFQNPYPAGYATWHVPAVAAPRAPTVCGALNPGEGLLVNQRLWSCDGRFYLTLLADGTTALYMPTATGTTRLWAKGAGTATFFLKLLDNGNLVAYTAGSTTSFLTWSTGTSAYPGATLLVRNDGNTVIQSTAGRVVWQTNTGGH
jgi:hypothetical protein